MNHMVLYDWNANLWPTLPTMHSLATEWHHWRKYIFSGVTKALYYCRRTLQEPNEENVCTLKFWWQFCVITLLRFRRKSNYWYFFFNLFFFYSFSDDWKDFRIKTTVKTGTIFHSHVNIKLAKITQFNKKKLQFNIQITWNVFMYFLRLCLCQITLVWLFLIGIFLSEAWVMWEL